MISLTDVGVVDAKSIRRTDDGYLVAFSRVSRAGVQIYAGKEVGRSDMDKVRVYRPESEVFKGDAMRSLAHRPVTNNHPPVPVTADNWKKYSVGQTDGDIVRDGQFVRVPMVLMDATVIKRVEDGERQLSVGYTCDLAWEAGIAPNGDEYDAIQRNIKANHVAVVMAARGGDALAVGDADQKTCPECGHKMVASATECSDCGYKFKTDSADTVAADAQRHGGDKGEVKMPKTIVVDGISCEMTDTAAQVVERTIANLTKLAKDAKDETEAERKKRLEEEEKRKTDAATLQTQIAAKDTEIGTLKKQVADSAATPQRLDEMVKARSAIIDKAKKLLGDKLVVDGKTDHEIRKQVVDAVVGDVAKGWGESEIAVAFATVKIDGKTQTGDGTVDIASGFQGQQVLGDARQKAYAERDQHLANAWQGRQA